MTVGIDARFAGPVGGFALDAAFQAPGRGVTALFGPSGSGKTTILRCVAGLARFPGTLSVDGEIWQDATVHRPPHARPVGYVFQEASLFAHLSVRNNLLYGAKRAGSGPEAVGFDEAVSLLGLEPLLDRAPARLSGGERQRVAVGRALLSRPRVLLMDEPLAALDRAAKDELLSYFETVAARLSIPVLYVSHDISEVARLAERMVLLSRGRTVAQGATQDLLARLDLGPATGRFEAGVLLTAIVAGQDTAHRLTILDLGGQELVVPEAEAETGDLVRLRVRARDVALATRYPEGLSIRNVLAGTLIEIVEEPDTAFAETLIEIGDAKLRARLTRKSVAELGLAVGMDVFALIKSVSFDGRAIGAGGEKRSGG
jgi:molybdate transport system ATP-binding protein